VADLRAHLQKGAEGDQSLCKTWQANIRLLGDLRIANSWSSIDSVYWPDYHLHLYNGATRRPRVMSRKHLAPSKQDSFPLQTLIKEKTLALLSDTPWIIDSD
jgi:hypothetical protein